MSSYGGVTIKVGRKQAKSVIEAAFPSYTGRKIVVEITACVWIHDTHWGGGTRNWYAFLKMDGRKGSLDIGTAYDPRGEGRYDLEPDEMVVEHSHFCGHDLGIRIYVHPALAPKWLPAPQA